MRRLLGLLLCLLASLGSAIAAEIPPVEVMGLLGSRELVGQVPFRPGEAELGPDAKAELDRISALLIDAERKSKLIRVEGFASPAESRGDFMELAMARARAVEVFLRQTRKIPSDIYLMGQGGETGNQAGTKVEVALYDTLLPIGDAQVDHTINQW